jgi:hypothetical protein
MTKKKRARQRKRLGFVPKATGRTALGHDKGFSISTRAHSTHTDRRKQASKQACRGTSWEA